MKIVEIYDILGRPHTKLEVIKESFFEEAETVISLKARKVDGEDTNRMFRLDLGKIFKHSYMSRAFSHQELMQHIKGSIMDNRKTVKFVIDDVDPKDSDEFEVIAMISPFLCKKEQES
ncbi:hypothetical protein [Fusobacterium sp. PH5-44]|uniref:hypothetical protein n=1 Tax=unclassified Fusobacterium TaxID=2648384 RepID=UPI003D19079F